jgi:predicted short-subunit dehydrogenase-like oxidoreductase (DUF2520 family)
MVKISIIGFGNVAQHLASAFWADPDIELLQVFSRKETAPSLPFSAEMIHNLADLKEADLYIIAVSDSNVAEVSSQLPLRDKLVAHTSGSLPLESLDSKNRKAVFYPLQTFSKNKRVDFRDVPLCLEAQNATDYGLLEKVASTISRSVYKIDSIQRKAIHVSAVFVGNFTNHLYKIGKDICDEHAIPFDILKPLIAETAAKIKTLSPEQAQTGPAIRNDQNTLALQLDFLSGTNQKNIYQLLTQSIQNDGKKL